MKNTVVENLRKNEWSFDLIYPLFKEAFTGDQPFWQKTASFYGLGESKGDIVKGVDSSLELEEMPPLLQPELAATLLQFRNAQPGIWSIFSGIIEEIAYVRGNIVIGTTPKAFGLLFLSEVFFEKSMEERIEYLVHELIHCELYLINLINPLFTEESHADYAYSVIARKDRPVHGRFHAAYVFYRLINLGIFPEKNAVLLQKTIATLSRNSFTAFGKGLFDVVTGVEGIERFARRARRIKTSIFKSPEYGCQRFVAI